MIDEQTPQSMGDTLISHYTGNFQITGLLLAVCIIYNVVHDVLYSHYAL